MRLRLILAGLLIIATLSLLACASPPQVANPGISCDDFMNNNHISEQVDFGVGEFFTVTLCSNPTTGFQWDEKAEISNSGVLRQLQHEFIGPESDPPPPPGTPGQQVWTFRAVEKGTGIVFLEYSRPWEDGEKAEWTYTLIVDVK